MAKIDCGYIVAVAVDHCSMVGIAAVDGWGFVVAVTSPVIFPSVAHQFGRQIRVAARACPHGSNLVYCEVSMNFYVLMSKKTLGWKFFLGWEEKS